MRSNYLTLLFLLSICKINYSQITLEADGPGNTYELINSVLAPGYNVVEVPDCNHSAFGRHIDEVFDTDLNTNVFRFSIHVTPDNDRCNGSTDRQRNEIKTYNQSPDNLLGTEGETVQYKWKFKLPTGFQSSSNFTHIHQLKSVNDDFDNMPMYTLTAYSSSSGVLRVRYAEAGSQSNVASVPISGFLGNWVDVTETITYSNPGAYSLVINRLSDGVNLLTYSNNNNNWREVVSGSTTINDVFIRPKWGIYRSLNSASSLRDEEVLFADFSIEENPTLSLDTSKIENNTIKMVPNPSKNKVTFISNKLDSFDYFLVYNNLGQKLTSKNTEKTFDTSTLKNGTYHVVFYKNNLQLETQKLVIK